MNRIRHIIEITGIVQGIGFRPYLYRLAREFKLTGVVYNHVRGVTVEVEGEAEALREFARAVLERAPKVARVDSLETREVEPRGHVDFRIVESESLGAANAAVTPDINLCEDCRAELLDPNDRRYNYPFINCTNCGPRFTIIADVPYDRPNTSMAAFEMCSQCRAEYDDPTGRRFHAQPNACPECGPRITLLDKDGAIVDVGAARQDGAQGTAQGGSERGAGRGAAKRNFAAENEALIRRVAELLGAGRIVALKGLGGFHLACDACNEEAVAELRRRKSREEKPLAVMLLTLERAAEYVLVNEHEADLLRSPAGPIVLLEKRQTAHAPAANAPPAIASAVAPNNRFLGVLLPTAPLHELLLRAFGGPLVMTSGNKSEEPIAYTNEEALKRLRGIADYFLVHDREIFTRADDSVLRSFANAPYFFRRSRGYAPQSTRVARPFAETILAVGGELKNAFCLARDYDAVLSHHIGDLKNPAALAAFERGIAHFRKLFHADPRYVAHDLHPEYRNARWARDNFDAARAFAVQHHHAHIAACLGEHDVTDAVIGIALDGTGYGPDGTVWGGELLLCDRRDYMRAARLRPVRLPGADGAIRHPWRTALSYLFDSLDDASLMERLPFLRDVPSGDVAFIHTMLARGLNSPFTSSCGRLFDGVAALAGIRNEIRYEGQAAIELEQCLASAASEPSLVPFYEFDIATRARSEPAPPRGMTPDLMTPDLMVPALMTPDLMTPGLVTPGLVTPGLVTPGLVMPGLVMPGLVMPRWEIDWRGVFREIVGDVQAGISSDIISLKFHNGLIRTLVDVSTLISREFGVKTVALSGGCLLNFRLLTGLINRLRTEGFLVLWHRDVPTNDGGLAFGQVIVANEIITERQSCVWQFP